MQQRQQQRHLRKEGSATVDQMDAVTGHAYEHISENFRPNENETANNSGLLNKTHLINMKNHSYQFYEDSTTDGHNQVNIHNYCNGSHENNSSYRNTPHTLSDTTIGASADADLPSVTLQSISTSAVISHHENDLSHLDVREDLSLLLQPVRNGRDGCAIISSQRPYDPLLGSLNFVEVNTEIKELPEINFELYNNQMENLLDKLDNPLPQTVSDISSLCDEIDESYLCHSHLEAELVQPVLIDFSDAGEDYLHTAINETHQTLTNKYDLHSQSTSEAPWTEMTPLLEQRPVSAGKGHDSSVQLSAAPTAKQTSIIQ